MIDKTGNSDTYSKFLSGSGSLEMKSDGVSRRPAAHDGVRVGGGRQAGGKELLSGVDEDDNLPHAW